ncbi:hypothetical protein ACFWBN_14635 [Streptomyces sp. NPDC059989]|uniref:hypothetical protein n=1 Tax=Streptomyces sp. NPDC059989 TaxID=3347026 RepID=UPI0036CA508D
MTIPEPPAYQPTVVAPPRRRRPRARTIAIAVCTGLAIAAVAAAATGAFDSPDPAEAAASADYKDGYDTGKNIYDSAAGIVAPNLLCADAYTGEGYNEDWMKGCQEGIAGAKATGPEKRAKPGGKSPVTGRIVDCVPAGNYTSKTSPNGMMRRLMSSIRLTNPSSGSVTFHIRVDGASIDSQKTKKPEPLTLAAGASKTVTYLAPEENSTLGSCMAMVVTTETAH